MQEHELKVGEQVHLRRAVFRSSWAIVYAGMPNDKTFALAITFGYGNQGMAYNLYFPAGGREIRFRDWRIRVLSVRPDRIRVSIQDGSATVTL